MSQAIKYAALMALSTSIPLVVSAQTTVFSDNFSNGSTLNGTGTATASSTSYDIASTKAATSSLAAGDLKLGLPGTTSGFVEAQAVFATTPISLSTVGDNLHLTYTFTDTLNILFAGGSQLYNGLYNSGGSAPATGLQSSGLTGTAGSPYATGGAALWKGYNGRIGYTTNTSAIYTRPQQSGAGTTSANQSLLGHTGTGAYANPSGGNLVSSSGAGASLTASSVYTLDFSITLSGLNTLAITNTLYSGTGTGGSVLFTEGGAASGANYFTNSFDAFAIGDRYNFGTSAASTLDISSITISDYIQSVPEPGTLALAGSGLLLALGVYRRSRS